jgi:hypothetical protein
VVRPLARAIRHFAAVHSSAPAVNLPQRPGTDRFPSLLLIGEGSSPSPPAPSSPELTPRLHRSSGAIPPFPARTHPRVPRRMHRVIDCHHARSQSFPREFHSSSPFFGEFAGDVKSEGVERANSEVACGCFIAISWSLASSRAQSNRGVDRGAFFPAAGRGPGAVLVGWRGVWIMGRVRVMAASDRGEPGWSWGETE